MNWGTDLDKLRAIRESKIEQQKVFLDKMSRKSKKQKNTSKKVKRKAKSKSASLPIKPHPSELPVPLKNKASIPNLYREHSEQPIYPSESLNELVELYRSASHNRSRHIAMCWPAAQLQPGLIHALATMQNQANGDKIGIRGVLFPCKSNVFYALNHLGWGTDDILEIVRRNAEVEAGCNSWITRSHPDKDSFLFSITALERADDASLHPALTDLMPHFYSGFNYQGWTDCSHRLLGNILARIRRRKLSKALKFSAGEIMGRPLSAPDALFAIDGRLSEFELKRAIADLYNADLLPDVVLISWPLKSRLEYPNWKAKTAKLIAAIDFIAKENSPGFICLTDDPRAAFEMRDKLFDSACKLNTPPFEVHAVASRVGHDGLVKEQFSITDTRDLTFDLHLVDSEADRLCREIYRVAKNNSLDQLADNPLASVIGLVARVSTLPSGLRDLDEQFNEGEINERTARLYRWLDLKTALKEYLRITPLKTDTEKFQSAIDKISDLMGRAHEATNFGLRLAKLVAHSTKSNQKVILVFESEFRRKLARKFLSRYTDYPSGFCFEQMCSRIKFLMTKDLEHVLEKEQGAHVIFIGLNKEATSIAICSNQIPDKTTILSTHRSALFLRRSLQSILDNFGSTFSPFKTRIESLIEQTPVGAESVSLIPQSCITMPDLKIELSDSIVDGQDMSDQPNAWLIQLDEHRALSRLPEQRVFIYDPLSESSSGHGFKEKEVRELNVGEQLFVMYPELRFELDELLDKHGIQLRVDDEMFESQLRAYHQRAHQLINEKFPQMTLTKQVRELRSQILDKYPQYAEQYPQLEAMRAWLNLGGYLERPIEELRPFAPAREQYFKAFALTLGMEEIQAAVFWSRVIQPFRFARRTGGRRLSDGYTTLLLEPEHLMSMGQIARREIESLTAHAREHTFAVEKIQRGPS